MYPIYRYFLCQSFNQIYFVFALVHIVDGKYGGLITVVVILR